ncbi:hypothetical protein BKA66DRAFT_472193 [Pyrenochaeta sp. MPI-SDFR-AT-0127]|nr:hypothetical protein BKA66DRAFT_472193 [Pyrenochaeta sp. MPI-SDFR-AT-0127]
MASPNRSNMNTRSEKDDMSMKSTSTMASTKSLLRSMLPSTRHKGTGETRRAETPTEKTERKLIKAEAMHAWALHR